MLSISDQSGDGPAWLWGELERDLELSKEGFRRESTTPREDMLISRYRCFYALCNSACVSNAQLSHDYPSCHKALIIRRDSSISSFKWIIEAMLMTKATNKEIAAELGSRIKPATIKAYRDMYFDVRQNLDKPAWVQKYIWSPMIGVRDESLYYVSVIYKKIAFYGGKHLLGVLFSSNVSDPEYKKWVSTFVDEEEMRRSLQFTATHAKLDTGGKAIVHASYVSRQAMERNSNTGGAGGVIPPEALRSLGDAIQGSMRIMDLDLKLGSKETVMVDMYTDEDLKNAKNE